MESMHIQFGIDEVYIHEGFGLNLLNKLQQRAVLCLDADDILVQKYAAQEMILIFHKRIPNNSQIYNFLKTLYQHPNRQSFIKANTLLNEEELFAAIKTKKFALVTRQVLSKEC